ncbi:hypothetical protein UY3_01748 [Chelonia mydas]|uniref:Uncharacterized protein n=1 Tax=Chelonia mydas TaxID=8469 RepID=M7CIW8_CHEMY|nr:hypothetical protein UY3_01748 [Chelonia mydas]
MVAPKSNTASPLALTGHGLFLPLVIFSTFILEGLASGATSTPFFLRIQTNTAAPLKPVIMQGTEFSRMEWKSINFMKTDERLSINGRFDSLPQMSAVKPSW